MKAIGKCHRPTEGIWHDCFVKKAHNMQTQKITTVKPNISNRTRIGAAAVSGAAVGTAVRYLAPTKKELSSIFNKDAVDSFKSNASAMARANSRSLIKYAGVGALVAVGLKYVSKFFKSAKEAQDTFEYSKYAAIVDAPDYACEIMWYGE